MYMIYQCPEDHPSFVSCSAGFQATQPLFDLGMNFGVWIQVLGHGCRSGGISPRKSHEKMGDS